MASTERKSPTIDDLRVKMCWICREEETRDDESLADQPPKLWVHPCSCTLIAHQECLLEWIKEAQAQPARRENALKCPQCGTQYIIHSRNPIMLRFMEYFDRLASRAGKFATIGLIAGIGVSFAGSVYGLCTLYGAHAVRLYIGDRLYGVVVGDDPKFWDWKVYLNLPMVPFYILLSHTRVFDDTLFSAATVPLLLSFCFPAPATLAAAHQPMDLPRFLTAYPPTPWLSIMLYPILRTQYLDLRKRLRQRILKSRPAQAEQEAQPRTWVLNDNEQAPNIAGDIRFDVDINAGEAPVQEGGPNPQNVADAQANANVNEAGGPVVRRVRLTFSSLGRFIGTALATPWIAKCMGALLEVVARHSLLLRRVLALETKGPAPDYGWIENVARESGALQKLREVGIIRPWQRWDQPEPVWWRNSLGLGLWIVAKDAVSLLHLFLRQRELQSRRILSRSFAGIDVGTLDLISPAAF